MPFQLDRLPKTRRPLTAVDAPLGFRDDLPREGWLRAPLSPCRWRVAWNPLGWHRHGARRDDLHLRAVPARPVLIERLRDQQGPSDAITCVACDLMDRRPRS